MLTLRQIRVACAHPRRTHAWLSSEQKREYGQGYLTTDLAYKRQSQTSWTSSRNKNFQNLVSVLTQLHFVQWNSLPFCLPSLIVQWPAWIFATAHDCELGLWVTRRKETWAKLISFGQECRVPSYITPTPPTPPHPTTLFPPKHRKGPSQSRPYFCLHPGTQYIVCSK